MDNLNIGIYNQYLPLDGLLFSETKYCLWLIEQATEKEIVNHNVLTLMQSGVIGLVHKEASDSGISILSESNIERILSGVIYTVDYYLKTFNSHSVACGVIVNDGLEACYSQGKKLIYDDAKKLAEDAEEAIGILESNSFLKSHLLYSDLKQVLTFAKKIYVPFNVHEEYSFSYPMVFKIDGYGIQTIINFVRDVITELKIILCFDVNDIQMLLSLYRQRHRENPLGIPVNLFSIIISNAAFATFYGNKPLTLRISRLESVLISKEILSLEANSEKVGKFVEEMKADLNKALPNEFSDYINRFLTTELSARIATKSATSKAYAERLRRGEIQQHEALSIIGTFGDMFLV